ncbi:MAG: saccharopine dehydrogenase NADP-binding domain-containing protein [Bacteroidetes bacterium]|nr:saccharopine dehydrogenase NADP-binding domain-containing protein [Bacteroidota bacterium]
MKKIVVLGAGQVGRTIATDLSNDYDVTSVDLDKNNLEKLKQKPGIKTIQTDLSDSSAIKKVIADADLVIGAVPGFMGFEMVKTVICCGKNIVDISFFNEDIFLLDDLAKQNHVTAVMDCGVAPGMDNIILGYHNKQMKVDFFECLVGGLPVVRTYPYEYKAPFSPIDVIAEYTRPARFVKDGQLVTRPALSDAELIDFPEVGTLEAFNTDGLRSLIRTMKIPDMIERTLRYPGHIALMKVLRETGFFSEEKININGQELKPVDVTARLLFPKWKLVEGEEEFTLMRVTIKGSVKAKKKELIYHLLDRYDTKTATTSMSRTTGYTCAAVARLVVEKWYDRMGISPPEYVGEHEKCFHYVMNYLEERNVSYRVTENEITA